MDPVLQVRRGFTMEIVMRIHLSNGNKILNVNTSTIGQDSQRGLQVITFTVVTGNR